MIRYLTLFSGIEAPSVAIERLGLPWRAVAFAEIDPAACAVLRRRWPTVRNLGDVQKVRWGRYRGKVDLLIGGSPCQDFSVAGQRRGMSGTRGMLTEEFLRAVEEAEPRWIVWENVVGILSSGGGRDFGAVLRRLDECGYQSAWRVLDPAAGFGSPMRRRRVYLVGHRGDWEIPASVLALTDRSGGREAPPAEGREADAGDPGESVGRYDLPPTLIGWKTKPRRAARKPAAGQVLHADTFNGRVSAHTTQTLRADVDGSGSHQGCFLRPLAADFRNGAVGYTVPTLQAGGDSISLNAVPSLLDENLICRRLTPLECARLMGLDDDHFAGVQLNWLPLTDTVLYRLIGNSMSVQCIAWVLERLNAMDVLLARRASNRAA